MKIGLFIPCLVDQLAPATGWATVRILEKLGHQVVFETRQTCCGQAAFNAGFFDEARTAAERFIKIFNDFEIIVAPSGSCVSMVRQHYEQVGLAGTFIRDWEALSPRLYELSSFLVDVNKVTDLGARFPHRVSIHNSCHALRELNISDQPRQLLTKVSGLTLIEGAWGDECCGFGGVFSAQYPALSERIAERRATALAQGQAEYITGVDDSCLINLTRAFQRLKLPLQTIHLAQILAGPEPTKLDSRHILVPGRRAHK